MKVGILGPGRMASALAGHWSRNGHELLIAARSPEKATELAASLGQSARPASFAEAVTAADAVLIGARSEGVAWTLDQAGRENLVGKVVIDMSGPVDRPHYTGEVPSLAEELQAQLPDSQVIKAFNLNRACTWAMDRIIFDGYPLTVPIAGDDPTAKAVVSELVKGIGCNALDAGPLVRARNLEAFAAFLVRLLLEGHDQFTAFNLLVRVPDWEGEAPPPIR